MSKDARLPNGFFRDSSVRIGYEYAVDFQIAQAVVYVNTRNGLALPHIDGFERSPGRVPRRKIGPDGSAV